MATLSTRPVRSWQLNPLRAAGKSAAGGREMLLDEIRLFRLEQSVGVSPSIRCLLADIASGKHPAARHGGTNGLDLVAIAQLEDVWERIITEVECQRHPLKPGARPNLKLLALRFGVTVDDICRVNGLQDPYISIPRRDTMAIGRTFLYIPPRSDPADKTDPYREISDKTKRKLLPFS
jgi:hypothetical protein